MNSVVFCKIYEIAYDKYYPNAPKEIMLNITKHVDEVDVKKIIKNITGYDPVSYKIDYLNQKY